jgi:cytidylate kinase
VTKRLRDEEVGNTASRIAVFQKLRSALLERQRAFREAPGLVADGRDMGTVVFPDAALKIYLEASVEARAERRTKQLMENGIFANMSTLLHDLRERDARDTARASSPLVKARDAVTIDSSRLGISEVVDRVLLLARERSVMAARS